MIGLIGAHFRGKANERKWENVAKKMESEYNDLNRDKKKGDKFLPSIRISIQTRYVFGEEYYNCCDKSFSDCQC